MIYLRRNPFRAMSWGLALGSEAFIVEWSCGAKHLVHGASAPTPLKHGVYFVGKILEGVMLRHLVKFEGISFSWDALLVRDFFIWLLLVVRSDVLSPIGRIMGQTRHLYFCGKMLNFV